MPSLVPHLMVLTPYWTINDPIQKSVNGVGDKVRCSSLVLAYDAQYKKRILPSGTLGEVIALDTICKVKFVIKGHEYLCACKHDVFQHQFERHEEEPVLKIRQAPKINVICGAKGAVKVYRGKRPITRIQKLELRLQTTYMSHEDPRVLFLTLAGGQQVAFFRDEVDLNMTLSGYSIVGPARSPIICADDQHLGRIQKLKLTMDNADMYLVKLHLDIITSLRS